MLVARECIGQLNILSIMRIVKSYLGSRVSNRLFLVSFMLNEKRICLFSRCLLPSSIRPRLSLGHQVAGGRLCYCFLLFELFTYRVRDLHLFLKTHYIF